MKKIAAIVAAAGIVGFAGAASAHHKDGHDQGVGHKTSDPGCVLLADGSVHANPGKMWQHIRENSEAFGQDPNQNPKQWVDNFASVDTPADLIQRNCHELDHP